MSETSKVAAALSVRPKPRPRPAAESRDEEEIADQGAKTRSKRAVAEKPDTRSDLERMPLAQAIRTMQSIPEVRELLADADAIPVDFDKVRSEIRAYTVTSFSLKLGRPESYGVDPMLQNPRKDLRDISKVTMQIQGWRDRVVTIYGMYHAKLTRLNLIYHRARHFLRIKYLSGAKGEKTPVNERIEMALYEIVLKREELTAVLEQLNLVSANLTNSHFSYRQMDETAKTLGQQMEYKGGRDYRD